MKNIGLFCFMLFLGFPCIGGFLEGEKAFADKKYSEAIQHFRPLAETGDYRSQYYLAYMYLNGYGVTKNDALGLAYLEKSLKQDYDLAQALMAFLYEKGVVVQQDLKKAIQLYQQAAAKGNVSALLNLGVAYFQGNGVPMNYSKAIEMLKKIPVEQQPTAGRYLGDIYLQQNPKDSTEAIAAYESAANHGDLPSYAALADIYLNGLGTDINEERGVKYYEYAASQGYEPAQYALGLLYVNGDGVERSTVLGHAWLSLASNQNYEPATDALEQLKKEMTLSDLDRARHEYIKIQRQLLGQLVSPFEEERRLREAQLKERRRPIRRRR